MPCFDCTKTWSQRLIVYHQTVVGPAYAVGKQDSGFFKRLRGIRKPVGAVKAPTGPLTPGSEATNILDKQEG